MTHCPSLNSALSFCQQEDRGPNSQASALRSIIHTQLESRDRREQRSESGQASDLGLGTMPELPVCSGIMSVFRACKFSYECLKNNSGDRGSKQNSNSGADVGDLISSRRPSPPPPLSTHSLWSECGRHGSVGLGPSVPPVT